MTIIGGTAVLRLSRRPAIVAGLATLSLAGAAAVPAAASDYPQKVENTFLKSCEHSAGKAGASATTAKTYCEAVLSCLEDKLTLKQFVVANRDVAANRKGRYTKVANACIRKGKQAIS